MLFKIQPQKTEEKKIVHQQQMALHVIKRNITEKYTSTRWRYTTTAFSLDEYLGFVSE